MNYKTKLKWDNEYNRLTNKIETNRNYADIAISGLGLVMLGVLFTFNNHVYKIGEYIILLGFFCMLVGGLRISWLLEERKELERLYKLQRDPFVSYNALKYNIHLKSPVISLISGIK